MIRSVAEKLKHWFDAEAIYRIGGDEFVVFAPDVPKDELMVRIKAMGDALKKENIHVSAGIARRAYGCIDQSCGTGNVRSKAQIL